MTESPVALDVASRFSRFRHDLQNDLQLVYGYLQLQKPTKDTLVKLDKVADRVRMASHIFSINNLRLSCILFDLWSHAEQQGTKLSIRVGGNWENFGDNWPGWESNLATLWTYYHGLAISRNPREILLELSASDSCWQICFSAAESVQLTCFSVREEVTHVY